ncbi:MULTISPECIES: hypothetical protein [unclassified Burkholderia]|uniref:hypothetical protein n=1 Tax=unclassified Burkholderia TaxID=2613784 RepID=UPI002AB25473|nr:MULTISPECIES: hypothetical protein [unclassified Burkholderia]
MSLSAQLNVERAALDAQRLAFKSLPVKPSVTPPLPPAPVSRPDQPMPPAQAHISPPVAPSLTGVVIAPTPVARVVTPAVALAITRATSVVAPVSGPKSVASGRVAVAPVEAAEKADKQRVVKARPLLAPTAKPVTREAVSATAEGEIETRHDPANANANAPARARDRAPTPPTAATVARVPQPTRDADSSHVEAVSQRQAQVADLSRGAVRMQSGLTISVGAKFPSGETLLRVDPAKHQIVTNLRTIVLMPSD